jgi:YVTN family beta-propeller protein
MPAPFRASKVNTTTNKVVSTLTVGGDPVNIAITPDGATAYVANAGAKTVSAINTATNSVVATIAVGTAPSDISITPDGTQAYVTNAGSNTVSVINTSTNAVNHNGDRGIKSGQRHRLLTNGELAPHCQRSW